MKTLITLLVLAQAAFHPDDMDDLRLQGRFQGKVLETIEQLANDGLTGQEFLDEYTKIMLNRPDKTTLKEKIDASDQIIRILRDVPDASFTVGDLTLEGETLRQLVELQRAKNKQDLEAQTLAEEVAAALVATTLQYLNEAQAQYDSSQDVLWLPIISKATEDHNNAKDETDEQ